MSDVSISSAPLTDHCLIQLVLKPEVRITNKKDYWKFNADLLNYEDYGNAIKDLMLKIKNYMNITSYSSRWEYFKFKVREFSIQFNKTKSRQKREFEVKLVQDISECCNRTVISDADKNKLISLQSKFDDLYLKRAQGAHVRSRARWIEEGEKTLLTLVV